MNKLLVGLSLLMGLAMVPGEAFAGGHAGVKVGVRVGRVGVGVGVGRGVRVGVNVGRRGFVRFRGGPFHRRFRMARFGCAGNFGFARRCGFSRCGSKRFFKGHRGARRFASVRISVRGRGCGRRCF